jgi:hypothetical protein
MWKTDIDYSSITLEEIDSYKYLIFECDGDSKKIVAKEKEE